MVATKHAREAIECLRSVRQADELPVPSLVIADHLLGGVEIARLYQAGFGCPILLRGLSYNLLTMVRWAVGSWEQGARRAG